MTTVAILGAGDLGGAAARAVAASGVVGRVAIIDESADVARGKALDILQAGAVETADAGVFGTADLAALVGVSAVILADRHGASSAEWAGDAGLRLLGEVRALNPRALVICAGHTQLELVERAVVEQGADRRRLFGSAPEALRAAAVAMACLEAGCGPRDVSLAVLGRPPAEAFVPWGDAAIAGRRIADLLTPPALGRLDRRISRLWPPGPLALAAAATRVLALAIRGGPGTACVFAVPRADGGEGPVRAAALPATFTPAGVGVAIPTLSNRDRVRLESVLGG